MSTDTHTLNDIASTTRIALEFIDTFWNSHDLTAADRLLAADYVDHAYQPADREGLAATLAQLNTSFPDHRHIVESHVAQDELVVLRMRFQATHLGDFRGTAPGGNPIDVQVYRMYRIVAGRITDHWALFDTTALLRQIGATATPQQAAAR